MKFPEKLPFATSSKLFMRKMSHQAETTTPVSLQTFETVEIIIKIEDLFCSHCLNKEFEKCACGCAEKLNLAVMKLYYVKGQRFRLADRISKAEKSWIKRQIKGLLKKNNLKVKKQQLNDYDYLIKKISVLISDYLVFMGCDVEEHNRVLDNLCFGPVSTMTTSVSCVMKYVS